MTKKRQRLYAIFIALVGMVTFVTIFLGVLVYSQWPAIQNEIAYALNKPKPTPTTTASPEPTPTPINEPAHVIIEKIGVDAPLQWDVAAPDTLEALNHGVAHLAGTAKPGEIGNTFITGHSSDFTWKQNPYAAVFSLLPKLVPGDVIKVRENGYEFTYTVTHTRIVNPDQVEVANQTNTPILTLMTCWPIGSTKQRFIIHANLTKSPTAPVSREGSNSGSGATNQIQFR